MFYSNKFRKFKNIKHCFFSRKNGFSRGIYRGLNCGKGSKDKQSNISKNLDLVSKKMNVNRKDLILMHQTHSNKVLFINNKNKFKRKIIADAMVTRSKNLALCVLTADCVPIILFDKADNTIACIHAGWRGALSGIIENTLKKIKYFNKKNKIYAVIGPCIGAQSYEVRKEFYKHFIKKSLSNKIFFNKKNKDVFYFNLRKFVEKKLKRAGVKGIENIKRDTFVEKDNFFSYRRSIKLKEPDYGRCISTICLVDD